MHFSCAIPYLYNGFVVSLDLVMFKSIISLIITIEYFFWTYYFYLNELVPFFRIGVACVFWFFPVEFMAWLRLKKIISERFCIFKHLILSIPFSIFIFFYVLVEAGLLAFVGCIFPLIYLLPLALVLLKLAPKTPVLIWQVVALVCVMFLHSFKS